MTAYNPQDPTTWAGVVNPAVLTPGEDAIFDSLWGWVASLFDPSIAPQIFKGYQNLTSTPYGTYIVISAGVKERFNQGTRSYAFNATTGAGTVTQLRSTQYMWQVDVYGPQSVDWSDIVSIAWRSNTAADAQIMAGAPIVPLFADEPQQLNIVNAEDQMESRYMVKLYGQVNQTVTLAQQFATTATPELFRPPVDLL
jgi:hypothetical protein